MELRFFLDTNAIILLLKGDPVFEKKLWNAEWIGTSAIVVIEFFSFTTLQQSDKIIFEKFINRIAVIGISDTFYQLEKIAQLKRESRLKLPDAVIAEQAIANNAVLVTNDRHFENIPHLRHLTIEQL